MRGWKTCLLAACVSISPLPAAASASADKAYGFLADMMDLYASGGALRLVQSYVPTKATGGGDTSYIYDDAVVTIALLARHKGDDVSRAIVLGDSLIAAQAHDPLGDGRVRDAYHAKNLLKANGKPNIAAGGAGSHTGNMAWTGLALMQLYHATGHKRFLTAAESTAQFVQDTAFDARGAGGYTGGFASDQEKITYKSTEHNIDLYALFSLLARDTKDRSWKADAIHALDFIDAMWNAPAGDFYIGTGDDGVTINTGDPAPEDIQTWSYLATHLSKFEASIDWALSNLSTTRGKFAGLSYSTIDRSGAWFEGTGHAAAALVARGHAGDAAKAAQLLADIEAGQMSAPNADGRGIDAASKNGLKTGEGGAYNAALHTGATAWYALAKRHANPFHFLK
jgi:hypothetical protein